MIFHSWPFATSDTQRARWLPWHTMFSAHEKPVPTTVTTAAPAAQQVQRKRSGTHCDGVAKAPILDTGIS